MCLAALTSLHCAGHAQVSHSHELQGLAFGDMIVAGVAADRMLYCYTPDHFPQNMEPAFMTHDGLPPPDVGSVEDGEPPPARTAPREII